MKQEISPKVLFAVIAVLVILAAGAMMWVWRAPTVGVASSHSSNASPGRTLEETRAMAQAKRQEMMQHRLRQDSGNTE